MRGSLGVIGGRFAGICAGVFGTLFLCSVATAVPTQFGSSFYDLIFVDDPFTGNNNAWETARAAAAASSFNAQAGYLATVTSQAENDFIFGLAGGFRSFTGAWLGGKSPEGWQVGPETGQAFTFTNFGGIEPNNNGYVYMNIGTEIGGITPGKWADDSGVQGVPDPTLDPVIGYFVEYPVPEPCTLLAIPATMLGLRRRR